MYELFFGLRKRPFAALPDPACLIPIDETQRAITSLVQCVADGRGIGVLSGPAGLGKTLVCRRVVRELEGRFAVVFLPSGNFLTRRALLQAILFDLGHSFVRMGDQELRLALTAELRRIRPAKRGLLLIADEAHLLAPRLLEELRTFADYADGAEAIVRLVASGQPRLEEILSQPTMEAFNQRVGAQIALQSFTNAQSAEYVTRRLAWAGGNVSEIFTRDALAAICEAADGVARCINQLADHSLSLGCQKADRPVSARTAHQALSDLKTLPLAWNEPISGRDRSTTPPVRIHVAAERAPISQATDVEPISRDEIAVVEFGDTLETAPPAAATSAESIESFAAAVAIPEIGDTTANPPVPASPLLEPTIVNATIDEAPPVDEEIVIDRYAALDAALGRLTRTMFCSRVLTLRNQHAVAACASSVLPIAGDEPLVAADSEGDSFDVVLPEDDPLEDEPVTSVAQPAAPPESRPPQGNRYDRLFTELRRRRRGA